LPRRRGPWGTRCQSVEGVGRGPWLPRRRALDRRRRRIIRGVGAGSVRRRVRRPRRCRSVATDVRTAPRARSCERVRAVGDQVVGDLTGSSTTSGVRVGADVRRPDGADTRRVRGQPGTGRVQPRQGDAEAAGRRRQHLVVVVLDRDRPATVERREPATIVHRGDATVSHTQCRRHRWRDRGATVAAGPATTYPSEGASL
jgi:hypothetical protein